MSTVLITGATGFLGGQLIRTLVAQGETEPAPTAAAAPASAAAATPEPAPAGAGTPASAAAPAPAPVTVLAVVRPSGGLSAAERLERLFAADPVLANALAAGRIVPLSGDITQPDLALSPADLALADTADAVVHAAAEVMINQTPDRYQRVNVDGTANVLQLAARIHARRPLRRVVHVSTAYVAGTLQGPILEEPLQPSDFNSLYESSKRAAETLVLNAAADLPCCIVRPAQIVGRASDGFITTFNTVYYPLKMYLKGKLPAIPASPDQRLNVVPVDRVVEVILAALAQAPTQGGETEAAPAPACPIYHAVLPGFAQPTVGQTLDFVRSWAADNLGVKLPKPVYVPISGLAKAGANRNSAAAGAPKAKSFAGNMLSLAPYFFDKHSFSTRKADALAGPCRLQWRDFMPQILKYATDQGFLNHTGRTVFEQMLVRLRAKRNQISYVNVSADRMEPVRPADLEQRILDAANALLAVGIRKGDRVALTGVNSADYLAADAAIGLVGAVSVPLYFTTPLEEAQELVQRSRSKLLIVGAKKLAAAACQGAFDVPCVLLPQAGSPSPFPSAADGGAPKPKPRFAPRPVAAPTPTATTTDADGPTPWSTFLAIGSINGGLLDQAPRPSLSDLATIRYTSGTTGAPKGVMFTHGQLVWMAQTMGAVLDWRTRNGRIRYLSFLPMSHVVEGILVAYAPYYLLTDVTVYSLSDFDALTATLPKVRPHIFFSVPRFYEKVWDQFTATGAGQRYLAMPAGPARAALGRVCRAVLLRKAGLQACRQLIVGSAPMSLPLMESFRDLGIEIHNAFGLTEAPLITLNRLGANDLGSLGQPLPQTDLRIDGDGLIWMRGPQLTVGYDGMGPLETDADGYFCTGDLGHLSPAGNVVIEGRRKELLVTSYGKNVQPSKVESLLKGIGGISEALLVGDGRPFCTALIWLEDADQPGFAAPDFAALDRQIAQLAARLSHPEVPKRWAVMAGALSVAAGDLTPNLKLRRTRVAADQADLIDALYRGTAQVGETVLHVGELHEQG